MYFLCFLIPIEDPQGIDLINGHHADACGENFESSILSGPELRVMKPHLRKSAQIDSAPGVNWKAKFDGKFKSDLILNITSTYVNAWHKNDTSNNSIKPTHSIIQ